MSLLYSLCGMSTTRSASRAAAETAAAAAAPPCVTRATLPRPRPVLAAALRPAGVVGISATHHTAPSKVQTGAPEGNSRFLTSVPAAAACKTLTRPPVISLVAATAVSRCT